MLGVALVLIVFAITQRLDRNPQSPIPNPQSPCSPPSSPPSPLSRFYYSQEARMYMLLAVCSAGLVWSLLEGKRQSAKGKRQKGRGVRGWMVGYVFFGVMGLWTHYSFPIILAAVAATHLVTLLIRSPSTRQITTHSQFSIFNSQFSIFLLLNAAILLAFAPWLPTAVERVLNWPAGGESVGLLDGVRLTLQTLTVGPMRSGPDLAWPWLILAGLLPIVGILRHRRNRGVWIDCRLVPGPHRPHVRPGPVQRLVSQISPGRVPGVVCAHGVSG